jgi:hypothetical protein
MAFIKTSSLTGKKTVVLNDQEWIAQGVINGWLTSSEIEDIRSYASKLANDERVKDQLLTKIAYLDDYTQAQQMAAAGAAAQGRRPRTPAQQAAFQRMQAQNAARRQQAAQAAVGQNAIAPPPEGTPTYELAPEAAAQAAVAKPSAPAANLTYRDPRTGRMIRMTPQQMAAGVNRSMNLNRFNDAVTVNQQRLQSMSPREQVLFKKELMKTPNGQKMWTALRGKATPADGTGTGFVQRLDPRTGKARSAVQGVKNIPGQFSQTTQNLGTLGRGMQAAGSGVANVGRMGVQGLGWGPQLMGGLGVGGLLMGAGGAALGAKGYQYLRDKAINNQVINQEFLTNPQKVNSALVASAQLRSLQGAKGATNAIDDAIERLNATVLAAINKMNQQSPLAQQVVQQTMQGMQQQRQS